MKNLSNVVSKNGVIVSRASDVCDDSDIEIIKAIIEISVDYSLSEG